MIYSKEHLELYKNVAKEYNTNIQRARWCCKNITESPEKEGFL